MASKKKNGLRDQVRALEALAGLAALDESAAREVNGGIATVGTGSSGTGVAGPPKLRRGTGAVAVRGGTGALAVRGTGAVAVFSGKGA